MQYAILCHDSEAVVGAWTQEEDDAAIQKLQVVQEKLAREGKLGPVARQLAAASSSKGAYEIRALTLFRP